MNLDNNQSFSCNVVKLSFLDVTDEGHDQGFITEDSTVYIL